MRDNYKEYEKYIFPWEIGKILGEGGYGTVFEIFREEYGHTYKAALKAITIPQTASEITSVMADGMDKVSVTEYYRGFVQEITKECALMSKFKGNSNIVSYEDHEVIEHTDDIGWDIFIRMELLTPMLKYEQTHKMSETDIIKLGIDICKALKICENNNVIHRDIKPENIFVTDDGNFKLGDFGIARTIEKTTGGLSKTGTTSYMAPEVYKGEDYGFTVDIYSLGMVLYRCLNNNRTPFLPPQPQMITYRDRETARMRRMKGENLPRPCSGSDGLVNIVLKACSYNSADRYRNASQMRKALEGLCIEENKKQPTYKAETGDIKADDVGLYNCTTDVEKTVSPFSNEQPSTYNPSTPTEQHNVVPDFTPSADSISHDEKTVSPLMGNYKNIKDKNQKIPQHNKKIIPICIVCVVVAVLAIILAVSKCSRGNTGNGNGSVNYYTERLATSKPITQDSTDALNSFAGVVTETTDNVLMRETEEHPEMGSHVFGNESISRNQIVSITFCDNLNGIDESDVVERWDVSANQDQHVYAWTKKSDEDNSYDYDLFIGADGKVTANEDCSNLFRHYYSLQTINFNNCFVTSNVTNMSNMFLDCGNLISLDLRSFDTSNVTSMWSMFTYCPRLSQLDVSTFDTSKVENMHGMFEGCPITSIDVSNFDTSNVHDMSYMFSSCDIQNIDLSGFNTSNVTTMENMFNSCEAESINVSNFNTSKVTNMDYMFGYCFNLKNVDVSGFDTSSLQSANGMFASTDISNIDTSKFENLGL